MAKGLFLCLAFSAHAIGQIDRARMQEQLFTKDQLRGLQALTMTELRQVLSDNRVDVPPSTAASKLRLTELIVQHNLAAKATGVKRDKYGSSPEEIATVKKMTVSSLRRLLEVAGQLQKCVKALTSK